MPRISPTLEGFRIAFRRPSLTLAEIAWRWTVGAVAWALFFFSFIEYLDTLPVSPGDATLLRTRHPLLVGRAIAHILRGSLNRAALAALLAALALSVLWIFTASAGRAATVCGLLDYFRRDAAGNTSIDLPQQSAPFRALVSLNFLRVAAALAAILALVGAAILVSFASPDANPQPGLVLLLFLPLAALICILWSALNWLLSLACLFAVRDAADALGALFATVSFCRERLGPVSAVSAWTGLAHLTAFSVATSVVSLPLAFIRIVPSRLVIATMIFFTLAYFAVADWLYMARLAGYVCIAEMPDALLAPPPPTVQHLPGTPLQVSIDHDEPILSDLPNLAVQT
jgi:hypothetical protein